jgi:biopolymer transport protein TolR
MAFRTTGNGGRQAMSEINVTPLVDVMLVLLIIFMVTAPMMQEGISVDLPKAKGQQITRKPDVKELIISVSRAGKIFVNENEIPEDKLAQHILEEEKKNKSTDVYLRADKSVPYGTVVHIMASLRAAGINDLGMITTAQSPSVGNQ